MRRRLLIYSLCLSLVFAPYRSYAIPPIPVLPATIIISAAFHIALFAYFMWTRADGQTETTKVIEVIMLPNNYQQVTLQTEAITEPYPKEWVNTVNGTTTPTPSGNVDNTGAAATTAAGQRSGVQSLVHSIIVNGSGTTPDQILNYWAPSWKNTGEGRITSGYWNSYAMTKVPYTGTNSNCVNLVAGYNCSTVQLEYTAPPRSSYQFNARNNYTNPASDYVMPTASLTGSGGSDTSSIKVFTPDQVQQYTAVDQTYVDSLTGSDKCSFGWYEGTECSGRVLNQGGNVSNSGGTVDNSQPGITRITGGTTTITGGNGTVGTYDGGTTTIIGTGNIPGAGGGSGTDTTIVGGTPGSVSQSDPRQGNWTGVFGSYTTPVQGTYQAATSPASYGGSVDLAGLVSGFITDIQSTPLFSVKSYFPSSGAISVGTPVYTGAWGSSLDLSTFNVMGNLDTLRALILLIFGFASMKVIVHKNTRRRRQS